ncbi:hypothetical protein N7460_010394 [Penicillium canescens]|uniref:Uncharacterized protein n=1 Tax=Penicillium canescens TaxID=5083 RepID=A0AAD6I3I6_PENCN|nr:hypothetical protein N7460_010394 [Penicillium canescens]KAJ6154641.1 hypothetical protein N7485_013010 [Penicillium canescens]
MPFCSTSLLRSPGRLACACYSFGGHHCRGSRNPARSQRFRPEDFEVYRFTSNNSAVARRSYQRRDS